MRKEAGIMDRIVLHSDCNSFYASVELLHQPELRGKPVAVGGDESSRHGIILSATPSARRCGVKTAEAIWQAKKKCPGLIVVPPDYEMYTRFSNMTRQIYLEYTDRVEPFGLDEAWLDVTGTVPEGGGAEFADGLRQRIKRELGITVSIGVSFNKIFAKLGSDYKKPDAVTEISRENFRDIVFPLPVEELLFVGKSTAARLRRMGIYTIGALAQFPPELLCQRMGKAGQTLHCYANGLDCSPVAVYGEEAEVKSVGNSSTAPHDLESPEEVRRLLMRLADSVSRRLRAKELTGRVITTSVRTAGLVWSSKQRKLGHYTNLASEIASVGFELFLEHYHWKEPVRSVGVCVSDLEQDCMPCQLSLFDDHDRRDRRQRLEETMDGLKARFGRETIQPAVLLKDNEWNEDGFEE